MVNSQATEILLDFVSLFFPRHCLACDDSLVKGEDIICTTCMLEMPQTDYHTYLDNPLHNRLSYRTRIKYAMALFKFSKSGRVQHLLHELKYKNHPEIGILPLILLSPFHYILREKENGAIIKVQNLLRGFLKNSTYPSPMISWQGG
jgi:predicted amidophosphoribosyltransferase